MGWISHILGIEPEDFYESDLFTTKTNEAHPMIDFKSFSDSDTKNNDDFTMPF